MDKSDIKLFLVEQYKNIQKDLISTEAMLNKSYSTTTDKEHLRTRYDLLLKLANNTQYLMERYSVEGTYVITELQEEQKTFLAMITKKCNHQNAAISRIENRLQRIVSVLSKNYPNIKDLIIKDEEE